MTVQALIGKLRKMPPRAKVVVADHDQDSDRGEFNGAPRGVEEAKPEMRERGYQVVISL